MYKIRFLDHADKKLRKLIKKHRITQNYLEAKLKEFAINPVLPMFRTHKVNTRGFGKKFSSRLDGDLRLIWDYDSENNLVIYIFDIGGHSGGSKVYQ